MKKRNASMLAIGAAMTLLLGSGLMALGPTR
jgi:hypothetical protein